MFAKMFNTPLAIIDKRRPEANKAVVQNIIGDVKGKVCIMVDDIIDTAGTLIAGADALIEAGALDVYGSNASCFQETQYKELKNQ